MWEQKEDFVSLRLRTLIKYSVLRFFLKYLIFLMCKSVFLIWSLFSYTLVMEFGAARVRRYMGLETLEVLCC